MLVKKKQAIDILKAQLHASEELKSKRSTDPAFTGWHRDTEIAVERIFGAKSRHLEDFKNVDYSLSFFVMGETPESEFAAAYRRGIENAAAILDSMVREIEVYETDNEVALDVPDHLSLIEKICSRFHAAARQLQTRHDDRSTLLIEDEYDVQDLLHAILRLHFDDVREEEPTPSCAGASSRVDFLLKGEQVIVEVKKTRPSMTAKMLGEQIIVDCARYATHPHCKTLVCFVYDPEGYIRNPLGIERDLESHGGSLKVRVFIAPKP